MATIGTDAHFANILCSLYNQNERAQQFFSSRNSHHHQLGVESILKEKKTERNETTIHVYVNKSHKIPRIFPINSAFKHSRHLSPFSTYRGGWVCTLTWLDLIAILVQNMAFDNLACAHAICNYLHTYSNWSWTFAVYIAISFGA